jgi:hypothetical protein
MQHDVLGTLTYDADDEAWRGYLPLRHFAAAGVHAAEALEPQDEWQAAILAALDRLRREGQTEALPMFRSLDAGIARGDFDDPKASDLFMSRKEVLALNRGSLRSALEKRAGREELFAVLLNAEPGKGPTPQQEAACRELVARQRDICDQVLGALMPFATAGDGLGKYLSLPQVESPRDLTQVCCLERLHVSREHRGGQSFLYVSVDAAWEAEHGFYAVYHRDRPVECTTYDGLWDLLDSDEPIEPDVPPTPNAELVGAVAANDMERARRLVATGHDVNALGTPPMPPLCTAVQELDVELARRLLELGADPQLRDYEEKTALERGRDMLRDFGETPAGMLPSLLLRPLLGLWRLFNRRRYADAQKRMREIVRLLETASRRP